MNNSFKKIADCFDKEWWSVESVFIMPFSVETRMYIDRLKQHLCFKAILDNSKMEDVTYYGISVIYAPDIILKKRQKILISSHYSEISEQLKQHGYVEFIDYIDVKVFEALWALNYLNEVHVHQTHVAITTFCSLNCKYCNMWMNHYGIEQRKHYSFDEIKKDFDAFFDKVDFCYNIILLGGEPLLNKELPQIIDWLHTTYGGRFASLQVTTNGTILPSEELLSTLKENNIKVNISDYTACVSYDDKLNAVINSLSNSGISYRVNKDLFWKNFYFPREEQRAIFDDLREHMINCAPVFRGLNDNKFFFCHLVWSAQNAGIYVPDAGDYLDLNDNSLSKIDIVSFDLGYLKRGAVSLCQLCGGCGKDNNSSVLVGEQE